MNSLRNIIVTKLMIWDVECNKCGNIFETWADGVTAPCCDRCESAFTRLLPGGTKSNKAKEPFEYLDGPIPDGKRIFSGPKVKNK